MELIIVRLVVGLLSEIPALIDSIQASKTLSEEQRKAAFLALSVRLEVAKQKVAAVTFKDV